MYVNVNPNMLKNKTQSIDSYIKDYAAALVGMNNIMSSISLIWYGDNASRQFSDKMKDFLQDLKKLEDTMQSYNDFIKGYVDTGDKLDQYYKNKKITLK